MFAVSIVVFPVHQSDPGLVVHRKRSSYWSGEVNNSKQNCELVQTAWKLSRVSILGFAARETDDSLIGVLFVLQLDTLGIVEASCHWG